MKIILTALLMLALPALADPIADANAAWEKAAATAKYTAIASCANAKDGESQRACYSAVREIAIADHLGGANKMVQAPTPQVVSTTPTTPGGWLAAGAGQLLGGVWDFGKAAVLNLGPAYLNSRVGMRQAQASEVIAGYGRDQHIATMGAFTSTVNAGYNANVAIAQQIQAPAPNITLTGQGVIGSGTYTGPVTRNCNGGTAASGGNATGTTGNTSGGAGAPANGGNC